VWESLLWYQDVWQYIKINKRVTWFGFLSFFFFPSIFLYIYISIPVENIHKCGNIIILWHKSICKS
jgi:hypothetical protein